MSMMIVSSMLYKDIIIALVVLCCLPMEKLINRRFILQAKSKLSSMTDLHKIGITGSVGKTSVKRYLTTLLSDQKVFASPKSFNTPLGLTKCINSMPDDSEIFVAEMGARKRGQISELCHMINPDIAIITNVSPAHIESFGSVENVYLTKKELSDYCQGDVIYNIDNPFVKRMYDERDRNKISVSITTTADYYATDIECNNVGTNFVLHTPNAQYNVSTCLLGKHNVTNIVLAVAGACRLADESVVISKIANLMPEEHRLQLIQNFNGVNIIDDSYNASADSITSALDTLALFSGRKIVASPGMVEGGHLQYKVNYDFGAKAGRFVDIFIIINNTNKKAIADGLLSVGFQNSYYAKTLSDAEILFKNLLRSGDTLLILNDLPDDYN